ncbi:MAG: FKBP-type peptidyl-prolyl cis-trans isomerase [Smithellaceae bacterium]|nr:FKBP-type peptidyl-prolyl cis-trans isomerase [Smithellaceae bacterium]
MKKGLLFILCITLVVTGLATAFAAEATLTDQKDKVSYSIGLLMGKDFKSRSIDINTDLFVKGLKDAFSGAKPALTDEEVKKTMAEFQEEVKAKAEATWKAQSDKNLREGETFLADNAKKEGVKTTASGLQYKVISEGKGPIPTANDTVTVNYKGTLIDGTEFDSSYKRGTPATFNVKGIIPGWTEALQMMKTGSKWQLFVPGKLAFGERGAGPQIGPNSTLIFEVELLSINPPAEKKATDQKKQKPAAGKSKTSTKGATKKGK